MARLNRFKLLASCLMTVALSILPLGMTAQARADGLLAHLTDAEYAGPSLEDNVALMDTDKNGFADVYEVRAFLELKHGKGYQQELLDKWQSAASGKSCGTTFAKGLYLEK